MSEPDPKRRKLGEVAHSAAAPSGLPPLQTELALLQSNDEDDFEPENADEPWEGEGGEEDGAVDGRADNRWLWGSVRSLTARQHFERTFDAEDLLGSLASEHQELYKANPHLRQVYANGGLVATHHGRLERVIDWKTAGSAPYRRRTHEFKLVDHWGQRKLLLGELEFLTAHLPPAEASGTKTTIIYAGAAPGGHLNLLVSLLPEGVEVRGWDPSAFEAIPVPTKLTLHRDYFSIDSAQKQRELLEGKERVLFVSDVRTPVGPGLGPSEVDRRVRADMAAQQEWVLALRPYASLLKFRLPYTSEAPDQEERSHDGQAQSPAGPTNSEETPSSVQLNPTESKQQLDSVVESTEKETTDELGTTEYLDGTVHFQVWAGRTSTESRLEVLASDGFRRRRFDHKKYESIMFYFNTVTRVEYYPHDIASTEGLDHCYDCAGEIEILRGYLRRFGAVVASRLGLTAGASESAQVFALSAYLSSQLSPLGKRTARPTNRTRWPSNGPRLATSHQASGRGALGEHVGEFLVTSGRVAFVSEKSLTRLGFPLCAA